MDELSITARFSDKFVKGLVPNLKERAFDGLLVVGTLIYQGRHGRLSFAAWKENVWEAATPWIWVLCGLAAYHVYKAAKSLNREVSQGLYQSKKPFIILTDGEPTRIAPNYQYKISAIVAVAVLILSSLSYFSWSSARRITDEGTFAVSTDTTFINMSQNLAQGEWWVTYTSPIGDTVSPVAFVQFIAITNLLSTPQTVKTYSVAIKTEDCGWTYLYPIYLQLVTAWYATQGLETATQIDFRSNGLDYILANPIPAYGTVSGWWFFNTDMKCRVAVRGKVQYRITLATFNGIKFEHTTPEIAVKGDYSVSNPFEGRTTGPQFHVPPNAKRDISKFYRALWVPGIHVKPNN